MEILFVSSFNTSSERFSKFDIRNVVLLKIKVSPTNIKETTLAIYFIKLTVHLRFTQLRVIRRINRVSSSNIKMENSLWKFSFISFLFKPSWPNSWFFVFYVLIAHLMYVTINNANIPRYVYLGTLTVGKLKITYLKLCGLMLSESF